MRTLLGYWDTAALKAAVELELFTQLGTSTRTIAELARMCRTPPSAVSSLCDYLVAVGLLRKRGARYRTDRALAAILDQRSPHSILGFEKFFTSPLLVERFDRLAATMRGDACDANSEAASSAEPLWVEFAEAGWALRRMELEPVAKALEKQKLVRGRVLDYGCGGSPLGVTLAQRNATIKMVAQDWPGVVAVAARHAERCGVGDRFSILPGDARTVDLGGPYDLVLVLNFLDYFDGETRKQLARRAHRVLRPGGTVATYAPLLDPPGRPTWAVSAYRLLLLAMGCGGEISTFCEIDRLYRSVGFAASQLQAGLPLVLTRKAAGARRRTNALPSR